MKTDIETLKFIANGNYSVWINNVNEESANLIRSKIEEIPSEFFEARINLDDTSKASISLIEFSIKTANMSEEHRNWLMEKYHINPYDMNKLQGIVNSIRVAKEYGSAVVEKGKSSNDNKEVHGIALASEENLDKAYPLWLAYLYANSKNPMIDIENRLKEDGKIDKYKPEYIVGLIEHTNSLMKGKPEEEKKDFYMNSISGILDDKTEISKRNAKVEVEI